MSINDTVQQSLTAAGYGQYSQYAQPVVSALVNREHQIVGQIIEFAEQQGLPRERARTALAELGMEVPTPAMAQPAPGGTPGEPSDVAGTLARIDETLSRMGSTMDGLVTFARQNGYGG